MPSVKKNFVWSSALNLAGYIFPLITFPYITRVLGVDGIGKVNFVAGIIQYFSIFAMLGITAVGVREIAKQKERKNDLDKAFSSLLTLNLGATLIAIVVLIILIQYRPSFNSHSRLLYIGLAHILFGTLQIEWLFKGLEDFRFVTIRSIAIRLVYVASVFIFVRTPDDYVVYYVLTTAVVVLNALVNLFYSRHFVTFSLKKIVIKPYIKPFMVLGVYMILTNMYGSFNVMFLGDRCGDIEVGYYTTATKLYGIIMSVFSSFTTVMLPRMSSLVAEGKKEDFRNLTSKSIDFLLLFSVPIIIIGEIYAPQIIRIIAGVGYEGAVTPMRIVMPLMLIIGYEQIIILQMLMPLGKDNAILFNSVIGATIALLLNLTIVSRLGSVGSAIVWCCCEIAVAFSAQCFVTKYASYHLPAKKILTSIIIYLPALFICYYLDRVIGQWWLSIIIGVVFISVYFIIAEILVIKNPLLIYNMKAMCQKVFKKG